MSVRDGGYGERATDQPKPEMWKLKCFKFFLKRLSHLERVLQKEEKQEEVNIVRVEMCESLMEEVAAEEQQVVEECEVAERQSAMDGYGGRSDRRKRGRSGKSGEKTGGCSEIEPEKLMSHDTAAEENGPEVGRCDKRKEEKRETVEERGQMEEEATAADQAEIHRDRSRDC